MQHSTTIRKMTYHLADKHLSELPDEQIIRNCPTHYGDKVTDDHKLFLWNGFVDHYLSLDEYTIHRLYTKHVINREPIIKVHVFGNLSEEQQQLVDDIVKALWSSGIVGEDENRSQYHD